MLATPPHNPNKDSEVRDTGTLDSVSSLAFSPKANYLAAGSWDNQVRCWEIQPTVGGFGQPASFNSILKASQSAEGPVLSTTWSGDGSRIFFGGCDNKARCWSLQTNQVLPMAQHAAPIRNLFWVDDIPGGMLATGSWDKTLKFWDGRQQNAALTSQLPERVYSMDIKYPLCVVATAERQIVIYDLRNPATPFKQIASPLKHQSRVVACFPDRTGFALGSIEGRVAIHHVEDKDAQKNFAFKCHRENNEIFAVNVLSFHPIFGTFATAGSDGTYHFWDKDSKQRLKAFLKCNQPISAGAFNSDGSIFAYAVSYDWSKGAEYYNPTANRNYILLHSVSEQEIKNRIKKGNP